MHLGRKGEDLRNMVRIATGWIDFEKRVRSDTGAQSERPAYQRLAIREDKIGHREFCIDEFQHLNANFVH
jgi:hypothetical protein